MRRIGLLAFTLPLCLCGCVPSAPEAEEAVFSVPNKAEAPFKKAAQGNRLFPSLVAKGGKRVDPSSEVELLDESGEPRSWDEVGLNHTATLHYGRDGRVKNAVVHGLEEKPVYLIYGTVKEWYEYVFFFPAEGGSVFLYNGNHRIGAPLPELVAMGIDSRTGEYSSYAVAIGVTSKYTDEPCPFFPYGYSPLPLEFAGYHVIE